MAWIIDGFLVVLFALCLVLGWERGFVRTVSGFIALAVAAVVAGLLSAPLANVVYTKTVEPAVSQVLEAHIPGKILPNEEELDGALEKMPGAVTTLLQAGGLNNAASILDKIAVVEPGDDAATTITNQVITPIVQPLIRMVFAVVLFVLTYILAIIVLRTLDVVTKLPLINQLNNVLGLVVGALCGILWVMFAVCVLSAVVQVRATTWLSPATLADTKVFSWLSSFLTA